ncbi:MAG: rod-binding protein [Deltaproteobacteria bacterium]|jgi:Rod binding domain-containing protein|nr:rod-binding protein [Deltaproteobacteria bacterium]
MSIDSLMGEANLAMQNARTQEMIRRKMEIDALRERLTPGQDPKEKLREACQGFETIFIQKMWDQMRKNVPKEGYLHSKQESMYQSMYDHEFSRKMAEAGGIGLGDMLYEQLSQTMAESSRTVSPGVNPRLPIIPASSSPSNIKFANPEQVYRPQIKPLYEDYDESAGLELEKFTLPEQKGLPLPGRHPAAVKNADLLTVDDIDFEAVSQDMLRREMEAAEAPVTENQPGPLAGDARPAAERAQAPSWAAPQVSLNAPSGRRITRRKAAGHEEGPAAAAAPSQAQAGARYPQAGPGGLTPAEQRILAAALAAARAENRNLLAEG